MHLPALSSLLPSSCLTCGDACLRPTQSLLMWSIWQLLLVSLPRIRCLNRNQQAECARRLLNLYSRCGSIDTFQFGLAGERPGGRVPLAWLSRVLLLNSEQQAAAFAEAASFLLDDQGYFYAKKVSLARKRPA